MTTEELNALIAQAESGDVSAMNQLGQIYGGNEFKDFEKAFYWHKKAAELGNVNSMSNLGGWCYLQGNGTEKNIPLADEWLKKCVENGGVWTWAFNELANIYANDAQYKDLNKAFYWYSKSAEAGDALGMSNLGGWCYLWGNGTEKNLKLAVDWLGKASEQGNLWSMIRLSCDIYCQDNEYKDYTKAFSILEKVFERYFELNDTDKDYALKFVEKIAETGNVQAMLLSKEHSWDPQKQEYWTKKAAEAGDAKSQFIKAGDALYNNDIDIAIDLFIKSAKGGNADAAARLNELGAEFQFGNNCRTINLPLAYKFYEASADCGNADGMANAAYCLSNGIGVEKDFKKCFELYSKAAELGNQFGYSNLGWCYMYGNGTEKNIPEAIKWLQKAVNMGNEWAAEKIAEAYFEYAKSLGTDDPKGEGRKYLMMAAEKGHEAAVKTMNQLTENEARNGDQDAAFKLGMKYEALGQLDTAKVWYTQAVANGHPQATQMLLILSNREQQEKMDQMRNEMQQQIELLQQQLKTQRNQVAESQRQAAEAQREAQRQAEEAKRQAAEAQREAQRQAEGAKRQVAEAQRQAAEAQQRASTNRNPEIDVVITYDCVSHISSGYDRTDYNYKERVSMYESEYLALKGNYNALCAHIKGKYLLKFQSVLNARIERDD